MTTSTTADGTSGGTDLAGRLTQMTNRTNLMVIDATLNVLAHTGSLAGAHAGLHAGTGGDLLVGERTGYAEAAAEVKALARRMMRAAADFAETVEGGCEPAG